MTYPRSLLLITALCLATIVAEASAQDLLMKRMQQYEQNILKTYLEYQKLYYEDKSRKHELAAFEDLLTVYIDQVMEIYETLNLSERKSAVPRDVTARALIFKSLMFLEKAPLNVEYYERACYEYYAALALYDGTDEVPVIYKDLPQSIQSGNRTYHRLIDLLDDKGAGLKLFGKVSISFRNFMVTANFDPENLELSRLGTPTPQSEVTYLLAEERIRRAFSEVFLKNREVETYVALPAGTYLVSLAGKNDVLQPLTRFYVNADQEHDYIMEPLADWVIFYEYPKSQRPDYYKFSRNQATNSQGNGEIDVQKSGNGTSESDEQRGAASGLTANHERLVSGIVAHYLPQFEIKLMFDLNDPEIKDNAIEIISRAIVGFVESRAFYHKWNLWTASWEICKEVREVISPGSFIPVELVELVHTVLNEL